MPTRRPPTPVYVKADADPPWPDDPMFYLLASTGLYVCRNHALFTSCVPAKKWPRALAEQATFLRTRYPKVPRRLMELAVGFFDAVYAVHRSEAAVLILWDRRRNRARLEVPPQTATTRQDGYEQVWPVDVHYKVPLNLPRHVQVIGDIHSHCESSAYASYTDRADETHRPGLHLVVGRIHREPPDFHAEIVVDGTRFRAETRLVLEGYARRRMGFPTRWMDRVTVEPWYAKYQRRRDEPADNSTGDTSEPARGRSDEQDIPTDLAPRPGTHDTSAEVENETQDPTR